MPAEYPENYMRNQHCRSNIFLVQVFKRKITNVYTLLIPKITSVYTFLVPILMLAPVSRHITGTLWRTLLRLLSEALKSSQRASARGARSLCSNASIDITVPASFARTLVDPHNDNNVRLKALRGFHLLNVHQEACIKAIQTRHLINEGHVRRGGDPFSKPIHKHISVLMTYKRVDETACFHERVFCNILSQ